MRNNLRTALICVAFDTLFLALEVAITVHMWPKSWVLYCAALFIIFAAWLAAFCTLVHTVHKLLDMYGILVRHFTGEE